MIVMDRAYVQSHLSAQNCLSVMKKVLMQECEGSVTQYLRTAINMPNGGILGLMPGYADEGYFGAKVLSVYHQNAAEGYPSHQGEIILFSKEHGEVLAVIDAMSVTQIRTGAVSAVASKALAAPEPQVLAIFGCGAQGVSHLEAMHAQFPTLKELRCWDVRPESARKLAELAETLGLHGVPCDEAEQAAKDADILCTVTPSKTPILKGEWVKNGAHVNAVGACAPAAREIDTVLAAKSRFFCDNRESIVHESGDFLIPLHEGAFEEAHLSGTAGEVLTGRIAGRLSADDITVFDAVGMAVEDIACAIYLYEQAVKENK